MRPNGSHLDKFRMVHPMLGDSPAGALYGYFVVPIDGKRLSVISSGEAHGSDPTEAWEHVSVSLPNRCPNWKEMCAIKNLFWLQDELVVQFHPPGQVYVNTHETCLHLWKSPVAIELPPLICV